MTASIELNWNLKPHSSTLLCIWITNIFALLKWAMVHTAEIFCQTYSSPCIKVDTIATTTTTIPHAIRSELFCSLLTPPLAHVCFVEFVLFTYFLNKQLFFTKPIHHFAWIWTLFLFVAGLPKRINLVMLDVPWIKTVCRLGQKELQLAKAIYQQW